jgi:hypothetical protein
MTTDTKIPRSRLERHLNKLALSILKPLGFKGEDGGCLREFNGGAQYFAISVTDTGGKNSVMPFGQTGLLSPHSINDHFCGPMRMLGLGQFQVDYPHFTGIPIKGRPCQTPADLPETEAWLHDFLLNKMVPCLEKYSDPHAILQAYLAHDETQKNTTDVLTWHGWNSAATGLIYARLYGPEHYTGLKQRYARIFAPLLPEYKNQMNGLLAYLDKEHIEALPQNQPQPSKPLSFTPKNRL